MPQESMTVLLMEDNPGDAELLQELLADSDMAQFNLIHVDRLATGLQCLATQTVDVVLLDLSLPDSYGIETLTKTQQQAPTVPIVVLTGYADEQLATEAVQQGAQDYLVKGGVDDRLLIRSLRYARERKQAEHERAERIRQEAARNEAETAQQRLQLLAQASMALAASLEFAATSKNLLQLLVPTLANWCAVDIAAADIAASDIDAGTSAHVDQDQRTTLEVVGAGSVDLVQLPAGWQRIAEAGIRTDGAMIIAPIIVRGRRLGALLISRSGTNATYSTADVALVEELALRVGVAFDNAQLYNEARQAIRLRDEFLAIAAHELRTPLTAVLGSTQALQRRLLREQTLSERDQRSLQTVVQQTQRLNKLIGTLLDLSRIQSGQLSLEPVSMDICVLVHRVVDDMQTTLEHHTFELICPDGEINIAGDSLRLEQALQNLLQNAVKYSPAGGRIVVEVALETQHVMVRVTDQGIGIPLADQAQLFERFYRSDNTLAFQIRGLGIGLAVVKDVVTRHGGTVTVSSSEGQGSTFTVRLPLLGGITTT